MWLCTFCHQENQDNSDVCSGCKSLKSITEVLGTQKGGYFGAQTTKIPPPAPPASNSMDAPPNNAPRENSIASSVVAVLGVIVFIIGGILYLGNITGLLPTFPYAGFLLMLVAGGFIWIAKVMDD